MCSLTLAAAIGGTILSAGAKIYQGQAEKQAANYNAQVLDINARLNERRATDAEERGKIEEQKKRAQVAATVGAQRVAMAANGVDIGFGSPLDTLIDTATAGELDALTIRSNTAREADEFRTDAFNNRADATMKRAAGAAAATGSLLSAGGSVLSGGSAAYKDWKNP